MNTSNPRQKHVEHTIFQTVLKRVKLPKRFAPYPSRPRSSPGKRTADLYQYSVWSEDPSLPIHHPSTSDVTPLVFILFTLLCSFIIRLKVRYIDLTPTHPSLLCDYSFFFLASILSQMGFWKMSGSGGRREWNQISFSTGVGQGVA